MGLTSVLVAAAVLLTRGSGVLPADPALVDAISARVADRVVLAPEPLVESLEQAGVTVWAGNPIDAFPQDVQHSYVDFQLGGSRTIEAVNHADAVVIDRNTDAARLMAGLHGWSREPLPAGWTLYLREADRE